MKRLFIILGVALVGVALVLVGCGGPKATEPEGPMLVKTISAPVEIEFWHGMSSTLGTVTDSLVAEFNDTVGKELGITVVSVFQGSYGDLKQKTTAAIKAGDAPEVAQGYADYVAEYLQADVVVALDDYINDPDVGIDDFDDIFEGYRLENSQYEGGFFYSLPFNKSTEVLYYNKTYFDEKGLSVPTTWTQLEQVSKAIYEDTGKPAFGYDSLANYFITMIRQYGGQYTNSAGEVLFNKGDAAVKGVELYKRNVDAGYWRVAGEDRYLSGPFVNGDVYMFIGSTAGSSYVNPDSFEWSSAVIPQVSSSTRAVIQQGTNVLVMNQNKSDEEVYAAFEFVKFLTSTKATTTWASSTGYLPIRASAVASDEYQAFLATTKDSTKITGPAQGSYYFFDPGFYTTDMTSYDVRVVAGSILEDAILNGTDPAEAVQKGFASLQ